MKALSKSLVVALGVSALTGCLPNVTHPVSSSSAAHVPAERLYEFQSESATTNATIVATRDAGYGCYMAFYIDNVLAARFKSGETATFHLAAGEHVLKYGRDPQGKALCGTMQSYWSTAETTLGPSELKRFRLTIIKGGENKIQRAD